MGADADGILDTVKKMLGVDLVDDSFDMELIIFINDVFSKLNQLGVGPTTTYVIDDRLDKWTDFLLDRADLNMVRTYMYLQVRITFDPPTNPSLLENMMKRIQEYEWRLNVQAEQAPRNVQAKLPNEPELELELEPIP